MKRLQPALKPENQGISVPEKDRSGANRTAAKWDKSDEVYSVSGFKVYWELPEDVKRYQELMMSQGKDVLEYAKSFFPVGKNLSDLNGLIIGCNYGECAPPIAMAATGGFKNLLVVDIAEDLLKRQKQITDKLGFNHIIQYECMDLNEKTITGESIYDFIFAFGTIHHIKRLEGLFSEINTSLREDGIFAMREYIGPSYIQFTDKQIQIANRILEGLPDYLKRQADGSVKGKAWKPTVGEILADDPSEAVRSQEIMDIVRDSLEVLVCNMTGGTILNTLLFGIADNFEKGDAERAVLRTIIAMEKTLIEEAVIPSDYVFLVAKKRSVTMKDIFRIKTRRLFHKAIEPLLVKRDARRMITSLRGLSKGQASAEEKTKSFWDKEAGTWEIGRGIHWTELIAIHERLNRKMSGDTYVDLYLYVINFLKERGLEFPLQRCLTLGCGAGDFERSLSKFHFCLRHDACDISDGAIEKAKERAVAEGLSHIVYEVSDINSISLPPDTYDVVFGIQSVHHFSALEHVFAEVRKSLRPGGFFVLQEFVGPNKFQWTDRQLNIINSILAFLPDEYCRNRKDGITLKKRQWRPTIDEMNAADPSEAVRSEEILKVLPMYFDVLDKRDLGGSILHLLLDGIAGNFDYDNPKDMRLLKMIFEIEDAFMEIGEIGSDFALVIARKR